MCWRNTSYFSQKKNRESSTRVQASFSFPETDRSIPVRSFSGEMWGEKVANGTWNGQVGMLGRGESDLAISNRYITSYLGRFDFEHYSDPFEFDVRVGGLLLFA